MTQNKRLCTLTWDRDEGVGYVNLSKEFRRQSELMQVDVLGDWLDALSKEYETAWRRYFGGVAVEHSPREDVREWGRRTLAGEDVSPGPWD